MLRGYNLIRMVNKCPYADHIKFKLNAYFKLYLIRSILFMVIKALFSRVIPNYACFFILHKIGLA